MSNDAVHSLSTMDWAIQVFDEFHFAAFIHQYVKGEYLFDIHPPFAKLTLVAVARLAGYEAIDYKFDRLGKPYGDVMYYPLRAFSATVGSVIPSVMYLTSRSLSMCVPVAVTTAAMALFDTLLCVESRLILTDAQLILYIQLCILFALLLWKTAKNTARRYALVVLTAVFGAFAVSTKWTGVVAPGMVAVVSVTGWVFPSGALDVVEMGLAGAIAIGIYVGCFWMHFRMLPNSGTGDAFMPLEFRKTLNGSAYYDGSHVGRSFVHNFRYLNWEMLRANSAIKERHPWESKWYEWLYNARGMLYVDETSADGQREQMYALVNPVLAVVTGVGVCSCLVMMGAAGWTMGRRRREAVDMEGVERLHATRKLLGTMAFFVAGWALNLVPYVGVKRCTFVYHVLPALQMACVATSLALQQLPARVRTACCATVVAALAAAFRFWSAWVYAVRTPPAQLDALRWMPRWT